MPTKKKNSVSIDVDAIAASAVSKEIRSKVKCVTAEIVNKKLESEINKAVELQLKSQAVKKKILAAVKNIVELEIKRIESSKNTSIDVGDVINEMIWEEVRSGNCLFDVTIKTKQKK